MRSLGVFDDSLGSTNKETEVSRRLNSLEEAKDDSSKDEFDSIKEVDERWTLGVHEERRNPRINDEAIFFVLIFPKASFVSLTLAKTK